MAENDIPESLPFSYQTTWCNRHQSTPGFNVADVSVADFSTQLAYEDDTRYLIQQAFRLIQCEFSILQQQVFRDYVLQEQSVEIVASGLGISVGTLDGVKSEILSRLRQELQQILD